MLHPPREVSENRSYCPAAALARGRVFGAPCRDAPPPQLYGRTPRRRDCTIDRVRLALATVVALLGLGTTYGASRFTATATALAGLAANGRPPHRGTVAADPDILPLGSRIRISGAGRYSGVYHVTDTGPGVKGKVIDIYVPSASEAKRFGRKVVTVRVLSRRKPKLVP